VHALTLLATVAAVAHNAAAAVATPPPRLPDPARPQDALALAHDGVALADRDWWNRRLGWYDERLSTRWSRHMPLVRLWSAFPLFEALDAIAIAQPTRANKDAVRRFAAMARRYYNPKLSPVGGYAYYIDTARPYAHSYFDDNGWWAIAFLDAYTATGDRSYLRDADRAYRFIVQAGWDPVTGGVWWETLHLHKTSEPLAAAIYAGFRLYRATGDSSYLRTARRMLAWADANTLTRGLYGRSDTDPTVLSNVEGMMIGADLQLCAIAETSGCGRAERLARASVRAFGINLRWTPAADVIYLRFLLDLYRRDHDPQWYALVLANAQRALSRAGTANGLFLRTWRGTLLPGELLQTHAATTSLFAWLATVRPPRPSALAAAQRILPVAAAPSSSRAIR
jgi:Glycosyl hydrolase family 76